MNSLQEAFIKAIDKKAKRDPVFFVEYFCEKELTPVQKEILRAIDKRNLTLSCCSHPKRTI